MVFVGGKNKSTDGTDASARRSGVFGWMMFDWAAQPFFTIITTFVFGPYFVSRLGSDPVAGQTAWAHAAAAAGVLVALSAPLAGILGDAVGNNKRFIGVLAVFQASALAMLWFATPGSGYFWPAIFMVVATVAAEISVIFNDALLPHLVEPRALNQTSNDAWGLGYLGGMIFLISFILFLSADPKTGLTILGHAPLFGLDPARGEAARLTGPLSSLWYVVFLLPFFFLTPDRPKRKTLGKAVREGFGELKLTVLALKNRPLLVRFLFARMLYMDGVNGLLILGGAFAASMFGWSTMAIGIFGIVINVAAIFGCFLAARISTTVRPATVIVMALSVLILATLGLVSTSLHATFFGLLPLSGATGGLFSSGAQKAFLVYGVFIGVAFGPVQAASRAFLATHIHRDEAARFFGFFSLTGRMTSFMATGAFAVITGWTGSPHIGIASLLIFLVAGLLLFLPTLRRQERA